MKSRLNPPARFSPRPSRQDARRSAKVVRRRFTFERCEDRVLFAGLSFEWDDSLAPIVETVETTNATVICGTGLAKADVSKNETEQDLIDRCLTDWPDIVSGDENAENQGDKNLVFNRDSTGPASETNFPFTIPLEDAPFELMPHELAAGSTPTPWKGEAVERASSGLPLIPQPVRTAELLPGNADSHAFIPLSPRIIGGESVLRESTRMRSAGDFQVAQTDRYFNSPRTRSLNWSLRSEPSSRATLDLPLLELDDLALTIPANQEQRVAGPKIAEPRVASPHDSSLVRQAADLTRAIRAESKLARSAEQEKLLRATVQDRTLPSVPLFAFPNPLVNAGQSTWSPAGHIQPTATEEATVFFVSRPTRFALTSARVVVSAQAERSDESVTLVSIATDQGLPTASFEFVTMNMPPIELSAVSDRWTLIWAASSFALVQIVWDRRRLSPRQPDEKTVRVSWTAPGSTNTTPTTHSSDSRDS
ncbi:MAG: hypothetical protein U1A77_25135 [Pirellulales bacterium]